ncbi:MAG: ATP-binding protein [Rhizonema sp. PD38]|nr:ATP-binding protein [Rhizonema sp. PD38]
MLTSLAQRLNLERNRRFVGRTHELELFQRAIASSELPFYVLHVFGPGGVGKTSLIRQFSQICEIYKIQKYFVEARNIEATSESFINSLRLVMELPDTESPLQVLSSRNQRTVILIDTYETLVSLDEWLREEFLPQLSENTLIVFAGRNPLSSPWRSDAGWQALIHILPLRNLTPEESHAYLTKRDIPVAQHSSILNFTHGHPLALSLVADVFAQGREISFQSESALDVVKTLLERFLQEVPTPAHRMALEACAVVRLTTEALLTQMLLPELLKMEAQVTPTVEEGNGGDLPDVHELFEWLRRLSFLESGQLGLFPHDLAREVIISDLRWRNPDFYAELHNRARAYYVKRLQQTQGQEKHRVLFDYMFLHRDNPAIRPSFTWGEQSSFLTDSLRETDKTALLEIVAQHEGEESAKIAAHWLNRQPQNVLVFRSPQQLAGFAIMVELHHAVIEDLSVDPGAIASWQYLQNYAPLRPHEGATIFRFWMARDTYQAVSPIQSLIFINFVQYYQKTLDLAYTFLPCAEPDAWAAMFAYADLKRLPQVDFTIGGRHYGVYGHDWRVVSPTVWQQLLAQREIDATVETPIESQISEPLLVLSQPEFTEAVRDALRHFTRFDALHQNSLLRSRLVEEQLTTKASISDRIAALQTLVKQAAESLQSSPRDEKLYRAIYQTYLNPAPTQEQAAELLDLPFSTYRRHLKAGMTRITEILWLEETS